MISSQKQTLDISTELPVSFYFEKKENSQNQLLIFLHGYTDSASSFLKRAYEGSELDFDVLAPNGPFPVPVQTEQGFKEAYSWYFEDHSIGRKLIPKEVTIQILKNLIAKLGLDAHRKTLVGFSQGGFLAPKLAEALSGVEKIIGIGCDYRPDLYENIGPGVVVFGIHGTDDRIVPYQKSFDHFQLLKTPGEFATIAGMGHKMNPEAKTALQKFILRS